MRAICTLGKKILHPHAFTCRANANASLWVARGADLLCRGHTRILLTQESVDRWIPDNYLLMTCWLSIEMSEHCPQRVPARSEEKVWLPVESGEERRADLSLPLTPAPTCSLPQLTSHLRRQPNLFFRAAGTP
ncbi:hypothetical protein GDO78_013770 [Eleutherodactylus coqui]|uniref:Uncharacterized protein n=1 Tax=Eleutherodactylus coqui TaxID=57060 RepID=A0A8J6BD41_ELECQ|nr:hypothetical protein GDO78_013770 [Eleutherodactylus coqui]